MASIHRRCLVVICHEIKEFLASIDLSCWSELEKAIFHFIQRHFDIQFKEVMLNNGLRPMGVIDGKGMFEVRKIDILKRNRNIEEKVVYLW